MSDVGHSARVTIIVADYATVNESNNKFTIVGSGVSLVGFDSRAIKRTAPLSVVAIATFDPKFLGESPVVELTLETTDGSIVELPPGDDAPDGPPFPIHIKAGPEPLVPTVLPGYRLPYDAIRPKTQMMMQFASGLPLSFEHRYLWRVTIDGESRDEWTESLYVVDLAQDSSSRPS